MAAAALHGHPASNDSNSNTPAPLHSHPRLVNGHSDPPESLVPSVTPQSAMASSTMAKKSKGKKAADPSETSKLLAAKISQLEQDAAGEKDQEAEIGW